MIRRRLLSAAALVLLCALSAQAQSTGAPFDVTGAFPQAFANNGTVLASGTLSFFAAGTATPQTVYSDAALSIPLGTAGVVTLDASGRSVAIFLSATSYKIILKDSLGATIATTDNYAPSTYLATQAILPVKQTTTSTGTVNDFALSSVTVPFLELRCNNASDLTITGFTAGLSGQRLLVWSVGAGNVFIAHQNSGSAAANRAINFATSGNTPLAAGVGFAEFVYDATTARWRLVSHEQGAWITPSFTAGDFTGSSAMTWTVSSGNRIDMRYRLSGRTLSVGFYVSTTAVAGTPNTHLIISNAEWGGFSARSVASSDMRFPIQVIDNGARSIGFAATGALQGVTSISIYKADDTTNWSASAASTYVLGSLSFEVQ